MAWRPRDCALQQGLPDPGILLDRGKSAERGQPSGDFASVRRVRLADIARDDAIAFDSIPGSGRRLVRLNINGRFIPAPTAAMIFREARAGRQTRVADVEQSVFAWR